MGKENIVRGLLLAGLIIAGSSTANAEGYAGGSVGGGFYGTNGPQDYEKPAEQGSTHFANSYAGLLMSGWTGLWLTANWGAEVSAELGPFGSLSVQYPGANVAESLVYGGVYLAPQGRLRILPNPLDLVLAFPIGYQYVFGDMALSGGSGSQTYGISAGTFAYGATVRAELGVTESTYGLFSVGYTWANIPNFAYSKSSGTGNSSFTSAVNKNTGADCSGIKIYLGFGARWGLSGRIKSTAELGESSVSELPPNNDGNQSSADVFYSAEKNFDTKNYAVAAKEYGEVPISFPRAAEARTKRGMALWWARDYRGAEQALAQAATDPGEWGKKAAVYLGQLRKGLKK